MRRFVSPAVPPKTQEPSITSAVKSMANVLLGPSGQTPIDNIIQMQHFQLWGFLLVVAALLFIVWLMQKKLDTIDKQYKEQFVLLHRLFKSHQDLQVEFRKKKAEKAEKAEPQIAQVASPRRPAFIEPFNPSSTTLTTAATTSTTAAAAATTSTISATAYSSDLILSDEQSVEDDVFDEEFDEEEVDNGDDEVDNGEEDVVDDDEEDEVDEVDEEDPGYEVFE